MSLLSSRLAWSFIAVLTLLPVSSIYALPILESATATEIQPATNIQPRDPRLIPDTEHYLHNVFSLLDAVVDPDTSENPTPTTPPTTPSTHIAAEQDNPVNIEATSTASATKTTQPTMYTTSIQYGDKPIENIQIGSGWTGGKKLQASDLPVIFDAVSKILDHRFRNTVDSSDERGLEGDSGSEDLGDELGFLR